MSQEVYAVLYTWSCLNEWEDYYEHDTELRQIFTSLEKAKEYCENPDNYSEYVSESLSNEFKPSWDESNRVYLLLDDDEEHIYYSIEVRNLQ